jgi:hypothetical protein
VTDKENREIDQTLACAAEGDKLSPDSLALTLVAA